MNYPFFINVVFDKVTIDISGDTILRFVQWCFYCLILNVLFVSHDITLGILCFCSPYFLVLSMITSHFCHIQFFPQLVAVSVLSLFYAVMWPQHNHVIQTKNTFLRFFFYLFHPSYMYILYIIFNKKSKAKFYIISIWNTCSNTCRWINK